MYELIILSLLMRYPNLHGYLIAKITNDRIGPWAKVSNGTLYPLLTKLKQAGLISIVNEEGSKLRGDSRSRAFVITNQGQARFHQLMMDTSSNLGDYQKFFRQKVAYIDLLQPRERLHLLNHYINYCQASILYLKSESEELIHVLSDNPATNPFSFEMTLNMMQHEMDQWQAEVDWTMRLREKVVAQIESEQSREVQQQGGATGK